MAAMIPLIRAGALFPFVRWMQANGRPVEERLREVDLAYLPSDDPDQPIPLGPAFAFVRAASRDESPDFACRIVRHSSVAELGVIRRVALDSGSVREALGRVQAAMRCHVTHALLTVEAAPGGLLLREAWIMRLDQATRHVAQQYAAALIQALCQHSGAPLPLFGRVALAPHPVHGVDHLRPWLGDAVEPSPDGALELFIPAHVLDRPLGRGGSDVAASGAEPPILCRSGLRWHNAASTLRHGARSRANRNDGAARALMVRARLRTTNLANLDLHPGDAHRPRPRGTLAGGGAGPACHRLARCHHGDR